MFFLPVPVYNDKKYGYKRNPSGKKGETKSCSARSLGWIANDFSLCDFVQNILEKAPAHFQSKQTNKWKEKKKKKDNDAGLEKIKNEPIICVHLLHTRAIQNKANVVCEVWNLGKYWLFFFFFFLFSISKPRSKQSCFRNGQLQRKWAWDMVKGRPCKHFLKENSSSWVCISYSYSIHHYSNAL